MSSRSLPLNLHHPSDQYDDIARVSGSEPGAGRSRWRLPREVGIANLRDARPNGPGNTPGSATRSLSRRHGARNRIFSARDQAPNSAYPACRRPDEENHASIGRADAGPSHKVSVTRDLGDWSGGPGRTSNLQPDRLWGGPPDLIFRLDFLVRKSVHAIRA